MKKKLLLLSALVLNVFGAMAQTDVTSTYLKNADFEGEYTVKDGTGVTSDRAIYEPNGWTVSYVGNENDMTILNSNCLAASSFSSIAALTGGGNNTYLYRGKWGNNTDIKVYQKVTLPGGEYTLSCDAWKSGSGGNGTIYVGNSTASLSANEAAWKSLSLDFTVEKAGEVEIGFNIIHNSNGSEKFIGFDNFKLVQTKSYLAENTAAVAGASATSPVETAFVKNGTFDSNIDGWTSTTGYQNNKTANNQAGAFTGNFWENWNGSAKTGKMYQTVNNVPNGTYKLKICAFVNTLNSEAQYVYANDDKQNLTAAEPSAYEVWTVVTNNTIEVGFEQTVASANWMGIDNVSLVYYGEGDVIEAAKAAESLDITLWTDAKTNAATALDQYDEKYATNERAAVATAMAADNPTSLSQMNTMVSELNAMVETYTIKAANEKLIDEKSDLTTFINTTLPATYPNSSDEVLNTDISKWTTSTYVVMNAGEHWSGVNPSKYYEQSSAQWGQNGWSIAAEETVNLPAGKYAFVVTARASSGVTSKMTVNGTEVALSNVGNVGYGIATNGEATYDMSKTYAQDGGRGWEYAYVEFELTEPKDVTFKLESSANGVHNWVSIANPVLYYNDAAKDNMELVRKNAILATITETLGTVPASDVMNATVLSTLNTKKTAAQNVTTSNTVEELNTINSELADAIAAANTSINNYAAAKTYMDGIETFVNTLDDAGKASYAVNEAYTSVKTAYDERTLESLTDDQKTAMKAAYKTAVLAQTTAGANMTDLIENAQVTSAAGWTNGATASGQQYTDAPDNTYLDRGWNATANMNQVVTLKAGVYTLKAATRACVGNKVANIYANIKDGSNQNKDINCIGAEGGELGNGWNWTTLDFIVTTETAEVTIGFYCENEGQQWAGADNFSLTYNAPVTRSTANGKYGTLCLPYAFTAEGAGLYTISSIANNVVTLQEIASAEAGVPYLYLASADAQTFTYAGAPVANPATNEYLVGLFKDTKVEAGNYVLQTQSGKQGFYKVTEENNLTAPAYKCYLNGDAVPAEVKALYFDSADAIEAIDALTSGEAKIYDINGRQLKSLQKGVNIVNGVKVLVK